MVSIFTLHGTLPTTHLLATVVDASRGADASFDFFLRFLTTPAGMIACLVFLALMGLMLVWRRGYWVVLTLMLWTGTFGYGGTAYFENHLAFPLSMLQIHGRGLTTGLMLLLVAPALMEMRGWRRQLISVGMICFFLLELVFTGRFLASGNFVRGVMGGGIYVALFIVLGIGVCKRLQSMEDVVVLLRCVVVAVLLIILGSIYQLGIHREAIVWQGRLYATTPNPQYAAVVFAIALLPTCFLLVRRQEPKKLRVLWGATLGFLIVFLLWTGSRTGALMSLVGLGLLFRFRIGKLLGVGIVAAVVVLIALQFYSASTHIADRLLSTQNTRSHNWNSMLHDFLSHPIVGYVPSNDTPSIEENSYLATAARLGLLGAIPLGLAMILTARDLGRLWRKRRLLGDEAFIVDLMIAGVASIAAGAMFEGFLLGTLTNMVFCIYIYLAILTFLLDWIASADGPGPETTDGAMYMSIEEVRALSSVAVDRD